ncbi:MAG: hypothetical protein U9Q03_04660 [Patescibacteria group bacterium]|nr:hypothetical protein [Patescibacteria group bacterium]
MDYWFFQGDWATILFFLMLVVLVAGCFIVPLAKWAHGGLDVSSGKARIPYGEARSTAPSLTVKRVSAVSHPEKDLVSAEFLGEHCVSIILDTVDGLAARLVVNVSTVAAIRHRGISTFRPNLRVLMQEFERSDYLITVRFVDGRVTWVTPKEWYRMLMGPRLRQSTPALPSAPHVRQLPSPVEMALLAKTEVPEIWHGGEVQGHIAEAVTEPAERVSVTPILSVGSVDSPTKENKQDPSGGYYEEYVVTFLT